MKTPPISNKNILTGLDTKKSQEAILEGRDWTNYRVPAQLAIEGRTDSWFQDFMSKVPSIVRKRMHDTFHKNASPRTAIHMQCYQCVGFEKAAIKDCKGHSCPLYAYRPQ